MSRGDLVEHAAYCRHMAEKCRRDLDQADDSGAALPQAVARLRREHTLWTQLADETDVYLDASAGTEGPAALF